MASQKSNPTRHFDSHCYRDDLNWIDTKNNVVTGAQEFYDATGIQFYVMFVKTRYHRQGNESFCRRIQGTDHRSSGCHRRMYPLLMVEEAYRTEEQGAGGLRAYIKDTA